jgi:hypothetical protein
VAGTNTAFTAGQKFTPVSIGSSSLPPGGLTDEVLAKDSDEDYDYDWRLIPAGPQGPPGLQGIQGIEGPQGAEGNQGIQGIEGPIGPEGRGIAIKGTVDLIADLPTTGNTDGDIWLVIEDGHGYTWDGTNWIDIGPMLAIPGPEGPEGPEGAIGPQGIQGIQGVEGPQGIAGVGVAIGGTTGQVLTKVSDNDYDTFWEDAGEGLPAGGVWGNFLLKTNTGTAEWKSSARGPFTIDWNGETTPLKVVLLPNGNTFGGLDVEERGIDLTGNKGYYITNPNTRLDLLAQPLFLFLRDQTNGRSLSFTLEPGTGEFYISPSEVLGRPVYVTDFANGKLAGQQVQDDRLTAIENSLAALGQGPISVEERLATLEGNVAVLMRVLEQSFTRRG